MNALPASSGLSFLPSCPGLAAMGRRTEGEKKPRQAGRHPPARQPLCGDRDEVEGEEGGKQGRLALGSVLHHAVQPRHIIQAVDVVPATTRWLPHPSTKSVFDCLFVRSEGRRGELPCANNRFKAA